MRAALAVPMHLHLCAHCRPPVRVPAAQALLRACGAAALCCDLCACATAVVNLSIRMWPVLSGCGLRSQPAVRLLSGRCCGTECGVRVGGMWQLWPVGALLLQFRSPALSHPPVKPWVRWPVMSVWPDWPSLSVPAALGQSVCLLAVAVHALWAGGSGVGCLW